MRRITYATAKELHAEAVALGLPLTYNAVRKRTYVELDDEIRARFRGEETYWRLLAVAGVERTPREAAADLKMADFEGVLAATRATRRAHARAARLARSCEVVVRSQDAERARQAAALCGCRRCEEFLIVSIRPYVQGFVKARPWLRLLGDVEHEAGVCVGPALDSWDPAGGAFMSFFPMVFLRRARDLLQHQQAHREHAAFSLDAPVVGAGQDGGRYVSFGERIPDRTVSPERIVLARETLREIVEAARDRIASAGAAFDQRVAAGAVA